MVNREQEHLPVAPSERGRLRLSPLGDARGKTPRREMPNGISRCVPRSPINLPVPTSGKGRLDHRLVLSDAVGNVSRQAALCERRYRRLRSVVKLADQPRGDVIRYNDRFTKV